MFILSCASFLIFYYRLILLLHMTIPIRHMKVTDHVIPSLYLYTIYGDFLDLPLLVIFHDLFISTGSYALLSFSPIFHSLFIQLGLYYTSIVMATHWPHLFHIHFMFSFSLLYFILLYTVHHRSYVHTCNLFHGT